MNFFASRGNVARRQRIGRQREAGKDVDFVAHDQFLRQALGHVGCDAAGILADEFELLAGDRVAMLLHIELDAVVHLRRRVGELPRIGQDEPDLEGVLGVARGRHQACRQEGAAGE